MTDLISFLKARIAADEIDAIRRLPCDCEIVGLTFEHGVFCPARVLAECVSKRELIEIHSRAGGVCFECQLTYPCSTLLILAAPWQLHPEFDPSWVFPGGVG